MNYYNEHEPKIAAWLRGLIAAGLIPAGHVDTRSIVEVMPGDLAGFTQCHFFAGIGGWSLALRLAGWPADRPVWTGSCPCQPYSVAGKGKGDADERNLWPHFFRLIRECRPDTVFGEQVESAIGHGWLDGVSTDLEGEGYAVGSAVLGAHSVGAPHIRQRLYWVADTGRERNERRGGAGELAGEGGEAQGAARERERCRDADCHRRAVGGLAGSEGERKGAVPGGALEGILQPDGSGGMVLSDGDGRAPGQPSAATAGHGRSAVSAGGRDCGLVLPVVPGLEGHAGHGDARDESGRVGTCEDGSTAASGCGTDGLGDAGGTGSQRRRLSGPGEGAAVGRAGAWSDFRIIQCRDDKFRRIPTEPEVFPLAPGVSSKRMGEVRARLAGMGLTPAEIKRALKRPGSILAMASKHRVGVLHGAGNAIVAEVAATFIKAFLTCHD